MSDLGALLRQAREERGLTLEDVQEQTKIRKRYLEAIEDGDHSVLPGTFYLRAFVKNYCDAVGLDADEVLRLYQHEVPTTVTDQIVEAVPARQPKRVRTRSSERISKLGFNIMMWSFLILIVVVVWVYFVNQKSDDPKEIDNTNITDQASPAPPTQSTDSATGGTGSTTTPTATPTPTPSQDPTTVTFSSKIGKVDHYDVAPAGVVHKVEITTSGGKSWTEVRQGSQDGKALISKVTEDGSVLSYDLDQPLYINVGRADLSVITVDGVQINDGDRAGSKKIQLNPVASGQTDGSATQNMGETTNPDTSAGDTVGTTGNQ
ncbi:helix-turn-helix domain-containing protein [Paenibacillus glycanilyticus]|uniref:XRE family transcriptional regulator n=1 Tax=Paenibacillus glycanilyticus TaxID=126569 RepID=A0ABQ6GDG1_9BACL|nr:RodZ domain-containing protein [Paenibacillus glycanilyticus]GLX68550.1 XRE family transcriptional regulator [Paenibacillus glycanilyticus]